MLMAEYRLSPAAVNDLEGIFKDTTTRWGLNQAFLYIDVLVDAFNNLAQSPLSSPACDYIRAGYRRRSVERHVIYFCLTDYGVAIIRILHDRMDASQHL